MKTIDKNKRVPLNNDVILLIKGLIVGKVLTLVVIGGVLWWLRPQLWKDSGTYSNQTPANVGVTVSQTPASADVTASNFQTVSNVPIGSFNYGGSATWVPIRQLVDAQIENARPELQLSYLNPANSNPSSSSGIRMLLDGQLDFAQSSRPLTQSEKAIARSRGFTLLQRPVAVDAIAVVVHPSLKLSGLTIDQLQQIYQGKITNWSSVGGPNLAIKPLSQRPEDGDTVVFSPQKQQPFAPHVKYVSTTTQALRQVSQTPGALYYASARAVVGQCSVKPLPVGRTADRFVAPYRQPLVTPQQCPAERNQLNAEAFQNGSYPITRNLYVIIKQNQGKEQRAGVAYANLLQTAQGQSSLTEAGFVKPR
ncbi:MAG TPA: phosphate ABC transporter substrate-binding protein [Cyanobacteria bacterium UBA11049]|nr:phosphate ABC transporter substrate-binding protein [Cyanobacteria bacterium UBA11049]